MSSKRQMAIIAVLIVLIGCVSVLARKINDNAGLEGAFTGNKKDEMNFFTEGRMGRENEKSVLQQQLEGITNDEKATAEMKKDAADKLMALLKKTENEQTIENLIKQEGYEDALCFITDTGADVCVKVKGEMSEEEANIIMDIVVRIAQMDPKSIVVKPKE